MQGDGAPTEPHADIRQMAGTFWQMYVALTEQGFTEAQAIILVGNMLRPGAS